MQSWFLWFLHTTYAVDGSNQDTVVETTLLMQDDVLFEQQDIVDENHSSYNTDNDTITEIIQNQYNANTVITDNDTEITWIDTSVMIDTQNMIIESEVDNIADWSVYIVDDTMYEESVFVDIDNDLWTGALDVLFGEQEDIADTSVVLQNIKDLHASSPQEMISYMRDGFIRFTDSGRITRHEIEVLRWVVYTDEYLSLAAYLSSGTIITTADGRPFNISAFVLHDTQVSDSMHQLWSNVRDATIIINDETYPVFMFAWPFVPTPDQEQQDISYKLFEWEDSNTDWSFTATQSAIKFWQLDQHLLFSKPVFISAPSDLPDGSQIAIMVQHAGQNEFSVDSLSIDSTVSCIDGEASRPTNVATVTDGKIWFYTCGASTFTFNYVWWANTPHYVDNGTKDFSITVQTWTQFATGSILDDVNILVNFRPIDNESPTWPRWTTNCYPWEKSFILIHPDGTQVILANAWTYTSPNTNCPQAQILYDQQAAWPIAWWVRNLSWDPRQPAGNLNSLNGKSPFGNWTLRVWDNANLDGVILFWFDLTLSVPVCWNWFIETGEQCDDTNINNADGCSSSCQIEAWWTCTSEPSICTLIPVPSWLILQYDGSSVGWLFTDISGNGNNWTPFNGVTTANQNSETVMCFNGSNQYLERVGNIITSYPFTMSSRVRSDNTTAISGILSYARSTATNRMYGTQHNANLFRARAENTTARYAISSTTLNTTEWFLVTAVFNSTTNRQLYINGQLESTNTQTATFDTDVNKRFNVGRYADSTPGNNFDGCIDDVRLYSTALTASQVYQLYAKPAVLTTSLVTVGSPLLTGTIDGALDTIVLTIDGNQYTGINHGDGTWSLPAGTIVPWLVSGTYPVTMTITNPYNRSVDYNGSILVQLSSGNVCIVSSSPILRTPVVTSNIPQTIDAQSDHFIVQDTIWDTAGYYTTLQISWLFWSNGDVISNSAIQRKANSVDLISGSANSFVTLGSSFASYSVATGTVTFLQRNSNPAGANIFGSYGAELDLRVIVPPYTRPGVYSGVITYTIYEN